MNGLYGDLYELFGVPPDASLSVIKRAYRRFMFEHHPDRCEGAEAEALGQAVAANLGFEVLSDPTQRRGHNTWRARSAERARKEEAEREARAQASNGQAEARRRAEGEAEARRAARTRLHEEEMRRAAHRVAEARRQTERRAAEREAQARDHHREAQRQAAQREADDRRRAAERVARALHASEQRVREREAEAQELRRAWRERSSRSEDREGPEAWYQDRCRVRQGEGGWAERASTPAWAAAPEHRGDARAAQAMSWPEPRRPAWSPLWLIPALGPFMIFWIVATTLAGLACAAASAVLAIVAVLIVDRI